MAQDQHQPGARHILGPVVGTTWRRDQCSQGSLAERTATCIARQVSASAGAFGAGLVIAAGVVLASCAPPPPLELDGTGVKVSYGGGTLWADLPPSYSNDQLAALASAGLRSRGYSVETAERRLEEPGQLRGKRGGIRWIQEAVVAWQITPARVRLLVRIEPWGHQDESRALLRDMLYRLGYERRPTGVAAAPTEAEPDSARADALPGGHEGTRR